MEYQKDIAGQRNEDAIGKVYADLGCLVWERTVEKKWKKSSFINNSTDYYDGRKIFAVLINRIEKN